MREFLLRVGRSTTVSTACAARVSQGLSADSSSTERRRNWLIRDHGRTTEAEIPETRWSVACKVAAVIGTPAQSASHPSTGPGRTGSSFSF